MNAQIENRHLVHQVGFAALGAGLDFEDAKKAMRIASHRPRYEIEVTIGILLDQRRKLEEMRAQGGENRER